MRCASLLSLVSMAIAMRASGVRESEFADQLKTTCPERVALVLDGPYGRWFARKIEALLKRMSFDDPFGFPTSGLTKDGLEKRLRTSMMFHCKFFESQKSCDGIRNARFKERMGKNNERVFPAKISPKDPSCFKNITDPGLQQDSCKIVKCYRELVDKSCRAVVEKRKPSEVETIRLDHMCAS
eukprot:Skav225950  [mRNA]  locus=scaffold1500:627002:628403:- [translate_table: standard]